MTADLHLLAVRRGTHAGHIGFVKPHPKSRPSAKDMAVPCRLKRRPPERCSLMTNARALDPLLSRVLIAQPCGGVIRKLSHTNEHPSKWPR